MKQSGERAKPGDNAGAHRGSKRSSNGSTTLVDLGISKDQSSQWQHLAEVLEEEREEYLAEPHQIPTASGLLAAHAAKTEEVEAQPQADTGAEPEPAAKREETKLLALWLCDELSTMEEKGILACDPKLFGEVENPRVRAGIVRLAPEFAAWLARVPTRTPITKVEPVEVKKDAPEPVQRIGPSRTKKKKKNSSGVIIDGTAQYRN
jgi:hypothetical protein